MSVKDKETLKIFAGTTGLHLANGIVKYLELQIGAGETKVFPDGELLVKLDEDVRGRDCFVVLSTCSPVNASLMELLIYIDCLRRAGNHQCHSDRHNSNRQSTALHPAQIARALRGQHVGRSHPSHSSQPKRERALWKIIWISPLKNHSLLISISTFTKSLSFIGDLTHV